MSISIYKIKILGIFFLSLFSSCTFLFYQPDSYHYAMPERVNIKNWENVFITTKDGVKLHAWHLKTLKKKKKGLILHFHGNAQNLTSHFVGTSWLVPNGYDVLIFDYRGYGHSEGNPSQDGLYYDALAALDFARKLQVKEKLPRFIVYGQSLGGIVSMRAFFDFEEKEKIDLLVMESTFSDYHDIAFDKLWERWFLKPFAPLVYLVVSNEYEVKSKLKNLKTPLLVVHGALDEVVPLKFGEEIYHLAPETSKKWFWEVEKGHHIDSFWVDSGKWREKLLSILEGV